jgi:hypothetical protein
MKTKEWYKIASVSGITYVSSLHFGQMSTSKYNRQSQNLKSNARVCGLDGYKSVHRPPVWTAAEFSYEK